MKQANILLKLSKDHEVHLKNVTPVEVLLLAAEHHRSVGGNPIVVDKESIKEVGYEEVYEHVVTPAVAAKPATDKSPAVEAKPAVIEKRTRWIPTPRSIDEECARLRGKYNNAKIKAILTEVRDIPTEDFEKAIKLGTGMVLPSNKLAETRMSF